MRTLCITLLAGTLVLSASSAGADQLAPKSTPPAANSGPAIQEHICPNGLRVLVSENHSQPLMTVELAFRNGAMTEPPELAGLSHLYEHMFFKANAVLPSQEAFMARVNELGIKYNGTTGTERVNYYFTTTSDHGQDAMVFMRDAIMTLKFNATEMDKERVVVTGEMDRNESSPYFHFGRALDNRVWYKFPTRKQPLGSRKTVLSATPQMMRTIKNRYYHPNNAVLVVTGDVDAQQVFAKTDELYAGWKKAPDPFVKFPLVKHPAIKKSEVFVMDKPVRTFLGRAVWHGPSINKKDLIHTYAADALHVVTADPSSRFQRTLIDSGKCLSASFGWLTQQNVGPASLTIAATPAKVDSCTKAAFAEMALMAKPNYVSAEELKRAARTLQIARIKEREKPSELAHLLSFWWASASVDYYRGYVDNVRKTTPADVERFMTRYIADKPYVFGALITPEMAKRRFNEEHLRQLAGMEGK